MVEQLISSNATLVFIPFFLLFVVLEMLAVRVFRANGNVDVKDDGVSVFLGLMSAVMNGFAAFLTIGALYWAAQYQLFDVPMTFAMLALCFVLDDFRFYLHHRIAHRVRWVWAMHFVHHSSNRFSFAVALRQPWTKHFSGTMMLKLPLVMLGFDPLMVIFCGAVNAIYQFFLHTQTIGMLPRWYEFIFNTPSHHRVHHGRNPQYLDANYAGTLIIWDRLLGTFASEKEKVDFGLVSPLTSLNPVRILLTEYIATFKDISQRGLTIKQRLAYLLGPPGWSHDGSRLSSLDIKRQAGLMPEETSPPVAAE
ncbi:sterol desaturase family protein [Alphaproteobacteria bacterium]|nr:sterol desaturase family protein [Alphaproteobacteria bacterium]